MKSQYPFWQKAVSTFVTLVFIFTLIMPSGTVSAQNVLPAPGTAVLPTPIYTPLTLRGVNIKPNNPFEFNFIIDKGDTGLEGEVLREETSKLARYFLAALTVPEDEMWVNLSPNEPDRIVTQDFGQTEMGRDLLAQDYMLKQLTASLLHPEEALGKKFWDEIYARTSEAGISPDDMVSTFHKIWIVPEDSVIYEHEKGAFVMESRLKVMLEDDYLAISKKMNLQGETMPEAASDPAATKAMREIILPAVEHEVNHGKTFAALRQIYNAVILANWYKQALKDSVLGQIYVNRHKTSGLQIDDPAANQKIYEQYLAALKSGVSNIIKEEYDAEEQKLIPRKYFTGGAAFDNASLFTDKQQVSPARINTLQKNMNLAMASINLQKTDKRNPLKEIALATAIGVTTQNGIAEGLSPTELFDRQQTEAPLSNERKEELEAYVQNLILSGNWQDPSPTEAGASLQRNWTTEIAVTFNDNLSVAEVNLDQGPVIAMHFPSGGIDTETGDFILELSARRTPEVPSTPEAFDYAHNPVEKEHDVYFILNPENEEKIVTVVSSIHNPRLAPPDYDMPIFGLATELLQRAKERKLNLREFVRELKEDGKMDNFARNIFISVETDEEDNIHTINISETADELPKLASINYNLEYTEQKPALIIDPKKMISEKRAKTIEDIGNTLFRLFFTFDIGRETSEVVPLSFFDQALRDLRQLLWESETPAQWTNVQRWIENNQEIFVSNAETLSDRGLKLTLIKQFDEASAAVAEVIQEPVILQGTNVETLLTVAETDMTIGTDTNGNFFVLDAEGTDLVDGLNMRPEVREELLSLTKRDQVLVTDGGNIVVSKWAPDGSSTTYHFFNITLEGELQTLTTHQILEMVNADSIERYRFIQAFQRNQGKPGVEIIHSEEQKGPLARYIGGNEILLQESSGETYIVQLEQTVDNATMIPETGDRAMGRQNTTEQLRPDTTGGIDMNPVMLNTEIQRNGDGVIIPAFQDPDMLQRMNINANVPGFIPVVTDFAPVVNLPLLLGFNDTPVDNHPMVKPGGELDPMDRDKITKYTDSCLENCV